MKWILYLQILHSECENNLFIKRQICLKNKTLDKYKTFV